MKVEYLTHMGDDLMVVNAARVSFDKRSQYEYKPDEYRNPTFVLSEKDTKLINHLARNGHWTPFAHPQIQVRVTVPIFIANQLKRSNVGLVVNEVSRRYVDSDPEYFKPNGFRGRPPESIKQGSSEEIIHSFGPQVSEKFQYEYLQPVHPGYPELVKTGHFEKSYSGRNISAAYDELVKHADSLYKAMIQAGVAPEMARMVLPQSMMTSWYWTGSLMAFLRVYKQRKDAHAQKESQVIAEQIGTILKEHFPVSFAAWFERGENV